MPRVVGTDPGTSSLDLLLLVDGGVADQRRLAPDQLRANPGAIAEALERWRPLDLIAGPSGYGLPLVFATDLTDAHLELMSLVRPDEAGRDQGIIGFRSWVRAFVAAGLPVVFLPGGIHLPTVPAHRKVNTIDLGTPDKVAVAALALRHDADVRNGRLEESTFALVEIGSAFSAVLVIERGKIVDGACGTRGPIGLRCGGAWDGEAAHARWPLAKEALFRGGVADLGALGRPAFRESLRKHVAGLMAVTTLPRIWLSGAGLDVPEVLEDCLAALAPLAPVDRLPARPGAWVKHAAQGAALLADGLIGGRHADLVESLELRGASGTIWDNLRPRALP